MPSREDVGAAGDHTHVPAQTFHLAIKPSATVTTLDGNPTLGKIS